MDPAKIEDTLPRAGNKWLPGPSANGGGTVIKSPTVPIFTAWRIFPVTATIRGSEEQGRETMPDSQDIRKYQNSENNNKTYDK